MQLMPNVFRFEKSIHLRMGVEQPKQIKIIDWLIDCQQVHLGPVRKDGDAWLNAVSWNKNAEAHLSKIEVSASVTPFKWINRIENAN